MANTELHLPDIANALQCIDIAAQRGAFQGRELSDVGRVRDRLESWVKENAPPTPADVQPPEPPEPPSIEGTVDEAETIEVDVTTEGE
tara:strand:+ start:3212 stop:3475 length:264 start_codon:yes stop_codon:yes gene_type:complete